jgi:hypothetical protein
MIEIFTFLEKSKSDILNEWASRVKRDRPAYQEMSESFVQSLLEQLYESYEDYLVTGEPETLDGTLRPLCRVLAVRGSKLSDVFDLPLMLAPVIRQQLIEEFSGLDQKEAIEKLKNALEHTDRTAHRAACRLLDIYQEHVQSRIDNHNDYLTRMQKEFKVDLARFKIEPDD